MKSYDAVRTAAQEIGYTECPPNSNMTKYGEWYGLNGQPWCCIFVQWCLRNTGLLKRTASCTELYNYMKQSSQIVTKPQQGDLVFFNFDKSPKPGQMKHIGIVETVNQNGGIWSIEGNTSVNGSQDNGGAVCRKQRSKGIMAYARPNYSDNKTMIVNSTTTKHSTLKVGCKGAEVKYLHSLLKPMGYGVDVNCDIYSTTTKNCIMHVQASNMLEVDGICGPKTWEALEK